MTIAIGWLMKNYEKAFLASVTKGFHGSLSPQDWRRLDGLSEEIRGEVDLNAFEWTVAEGELWLGRGVKAMSFRAADLVLGPDGPDLAPDQIAYVESMTRQPLRLYEVLETDRERGILLKPLVSGTPRLYRVKKGLLHDYVQWELIFARLLRLDGEWEQSAEDYPLSHALSEWLVDEIPKVARKAAKYAPPEIIDRILSRAVISQWLAEILAPPSLPQVVDAGTGQPLLLVTEQYNVMDWDRLAQALESQLDVDGSREFGWIRYEQASAGMRRIALAMNLSEKYPDRIELFTRTLSRADDGRAWLERAAGDSIRFLGRVVVDPLSPSAHHDLARRRPPQEDSERTGPERREITRKMYEYTYRNWPQESIPVLGNRSPRAAMRTARGRARVIRLIKSYEANEFRRARREDRDPVSLEFLWERLGLSRQSIVAIEAGEGN